MQKPSTFGRGSCDPGESLAYSQHPGDQRADAGEKISSLMDPQTTAGTHWSATWFGRRRRARPRVSSRKGAATWTGPRLRAVRHILEAGSCCEPGVTIQGRRSTAGAAFESGHVGVFKLGRLSPVLGTGDGKDLRVRSSSSPIFQQDARNRAFGHEQAFIPLQDLGLRCHRRKPARGARLRGAQ